MSTVAFQWINFLILFAVLFIVLKKALASHYKKQRAELEQKVAEASAKFTQMKREYDEVSALLAKYETTAEEIRTSAMREIEFQKNKIESDTAAQIKKIMADSEARVRNEIEKAKEGLEKEVMQKALLAAREQLQRDFKSKDQDWTAQLIQSETNLAQGKKNYAS